MKKENATTRLKEMILVTQAEKAVLGELLKNDFILLHESMKPINLLKKTLGNIAESAGKSSMIDSSLGMAAGYLSKKIIVGASHNPFVKMAGSVLQFGISTLVMKNPAAIKSVGGFILKNIFRKKEATSDKPT